MRYLQQQHGTEIRRTIGQFVSLECWQQESYAVFGLSLLFHVLDRSALQSWKSVGHSLGAENERTPNNILNKFPRCD
jgi:hypothetical protein